jgi:hypothetical protein
MIVGNDEVNEVLQEYCQREWWQFPVVHFVYIAMDGYTVYLGR